MKIYTSKISIEQISIILDYDYYIKIKPQNSVIPQQYAIFCSIHNIE